MPHIAVRSAFDGADEKVSRLGLAPLWRELEGILTGLDLLVEEKKEPAAGQGSGSAERLGARAE